MGDFYSGITVPMVVQEISDGNYNLHKRKASYLIHTTSFCNKTWQNKRDRESYNDGLISVYIIIATFHFLAGNEASREPRMNIKVYVQALKFE